MCRLWTVHHVRCYCWRLPPQMKLRPVAMCLPSCHHLLQHGGTPPPPPPRCVVLKNNEPAVMYVETGDAVLRVLTEHKPLWGGDNQRQGLHRCSTLACVLCECKHGYVCMFVLMSSTRLPESFVEILVQGLWEWMLNCFFFQAFCLFSFRPQRFSQF